MAVESEQTPLLSSLDNVDRLYRTRSKDPAPNIVDFNVEYDPDNPQAWSTTYKYLVTALLAFLAFTTTFTCIGVVPVADRIVRDLSPDHKPDKSASVLLVTIWELGEAAGPLLIGPLSEIHGRFVVLNTANVLFLGTTIMAALSQSTTLFIVARALTGLAVAANVLNPAIVSDIFISEQRGSAMSLIMLAPLTGGAVGPAIAGALTESLGWRSVVWLSALSMSICTLCVFFVLRETYKVVILRRRAAHLRETTGNAELRTPYDGERDSLLTSVLRPFFVFVNTPSLILVSLFASVTFTYFYIMSTTLPEILGTFYHLSPAKTGSAFIAFSLGSLVAVLICNLILDRVYIYLRDRPVRRFYREQKQGHSPTTRAPPSPRAYSHHRLPPVIIGAIFFPATIAFYGLLPVGFSLDGSAAPAPLPYTLLNLAILGFFLLFSYLPVMPYITELSPLYAASSMTAVIVCRCLFSTFLPLCVSPLVRQIGWGKAFLALAGICWIAGGLPVGMFVYGERKQRLEEEKEVDGVIGGS